MLRLYAVLIGRAGWPLEYIDGMELEDAVEAADLLDKLHVEERREELLVTSYGMADKKGRRQIDMAFPNPWKKERKRRLLKGKKKKRADEVEADVRKKYSGV